MNLNEAREILPRLEQCCRPEHTLAPRGPESVSFAIKMGWAEPKYSRTETDAAGDALIASKNLDEAQDETLAIINNWRSSHAFPLNTFQMGLRTRARAVDSESVVAQRIKRLSSIDLKLRRFAWLKLSAMQDVAGCRAVVSSFRRVDELADSYKTSDLKHKLDDEDDYIRNPKKSGYRGYHLIYRYYSDRKATYNGLKIEVQLRSVLQHAWATAVETVGIFIHQALKASRGEKEWLRFFALMGSAIALRERTPLVPDTPTSRKELMAEIREYSRQIDVERRLQTYGAVVKHLEESDTTGARYFLLMVDPDAERIRIRGFTTRESEAAAREYLALERSIADRPGADAVLVSADSLASLRRAYPNYFLDTRVFLNALRKAIA